MSEHIGLKRGSVSLTNHSDGWWLAFAAERTALLKIMGDAVLDIQHVGSTSIPNIAAKPIIDILAAVRGLSDVAGFRMGLESAGYHHRENSPDGPQILFAKGPEERRTHYLHITQMGSSVWRGHLAFRDYLRSHPEEAQRYEELKRALALTFANDRQSYTAGKRDYIESILAKSTTA